MPKKDLSKYVKVKVPVTKGPKKGTYTTVYKKKAELEKEKKQKKAPKESSFFMDVAKYLKMVDLHDAIYDVAVHAPADIDIPSRLSDHEAVLLLDETTYPSYMRHMTHILRQLRDKTYTSKEQLAHEKLAFSWKVEADKLHTRASHETHKRLNKLLDKLWDAAEGTEDEEPAKPLSVKAPKEPKKFTKAGIRKYARELYTSLTELQKLAKDRNNHMKSITLEGSLAKAVLHAYSYGGPKGRVHLKDGTVIRSEHIGNHTGRRNADRPPGTVICAYYDVTPLESAKKYLSGYAVFHMDDVESIEVDNVTSMDYMMSPMGIAGDMASFAGGCYVGQHLLADWYGSANGPASKVFAHALELMGAVPKAYRWNRGEAKYEPVSKAIKGKGEATFDAVRYAKQRYHVTQELLEGKSKTWTMYRGLKGEVAQGISDHFLEHGENASVALNCRTLESWATDKGVAKNFGQTVLVAQVPNEAVFVDPRVSAIMTDFRESEALVVQMNKDKKKGNLPRFVVDDLLEEKETSWGDTYAEYSVKLRGEKPRVPVAEPKKVTIKSLEARRKELQKIMKKQDDIMDKLHDKHGDDHADWPEEAQEAFEEAEDTWYAADEESNHHFNKIFKMQEANKKKKATKAAAKKKKEESKASSANLKKLQKKMKSLRADKMAAEKIMNKIENKHGNRPDGSYIGKDKWPKAAVEAHNEAEAEWYDLDDQVADLAEEMSKMKLQLKAKKGITHFFKKSDRGKIRKRIAYQRNGKTHYRWQWVNAPTGETAPVPGQDEDYRTHLAYVFTEGREAYTKNVLEKVKEFHEELRAKGKPIPETRAQAQAKRTAKRQAAVLPRDMGRLYSLAPMVRHKIARETDAIASKNQGKWLRPVGVDTMGYSVKKVGKRVHVRDRSGRRQQSFATMGEAIEHIYQETGPRAEEIAHQERRQGKKSKTKPLKIEKVKTKEKQDVHVEPRRREDTKKRKVVSTRVALRRIKEGSWGQVGGHDVYRNLSGGYELPGGVKAKNLASAVKHMSELKVKKPSKEETAKSGTAGAISVGSRISFGRFGQTVTGKVTKVTRKGSQVIVTIGGTDYPMASHRRVKFLKGERTARLTFTPDGQLVQIWH